MGNMFARACIGASIAETGKVEPITEKLRAAQRLQMLIDMRSDGARPNMAVPNP